MANRSWTQFSLCSLKGVVMVFPAVKFAATSAPTLLAWNGNPNKGFYAAAPSVGTIDTKSVTRNSVGNYTLVLQDRYTRLLSFGCTLIGSANATAPIVQVKVASDPNAANATVAAGLGTTFDTINFLIFSATGTAADPAATELGLFEIQLQNSMAI